MPPLEKSPTAAFPLSAANFAAAVVKWQKRHGRHDLPWQQNPTPYRIWLSEVMLQQTQVTAVIPYYLNFCRRFPDWATLAHAGADSVLAAWSGLGYYARARNLHRAAQLVHHHGIPQTKEAWLALPGVGESTAAAITVFTGGAPQAILDGNVKRVLTRVSALPFATGDTAAEKMLWTLARLLLPPKRHICAYTQGLMDLGATVCRRTRPQCGQCPLAAHCLAHQRGQTDQYPRPRQRKTKPEKQVIMLLARRNGRILLQRRPPSGIWGGLWSLPEATTAQQLRHDWEAALGVNLSPAGQQHFRHEFTHYRLSATVKIFTCDNSTTTIPKNTCQSTVAVVSCQDSGTLKTPENTRWFSRRDLKKIGVPAPILTCLTAGLRPPTPPTPAARRARRV